ncbi:permease prefix domain 1-containing protein [Cumulibacter manganitolerans]|uniref:permease prefix domain 1-containing protein n=1 Tax=Cumulibacter manganitolerans TaxID=1884992 RepID=UPI001E3CF6A3|nr:permease prefix domain 1-containing protein [Cumulibacter manganitolerans]
MMDVEAQIEQWRRFLARHPAITDDDAEEMEGHLRDQIDALNDAGLSPDEAFLVSVKRMGAHDAISREFAQEHSERLWKQLVTPGTAARAHRRGIPAMLAFAVAAAVVVRAGIAVLGQDRAVANAPLALAPLVCYLAWTRRLSPTAWVAVGGAAASTALLLNLYPFADAGVTRGIAAAHGAVVMWFVVGVAYAGGEWRPARRRMDFIRFTGEWVIYLALLALGGGVLVGLAAGVFNAVDVDPATALGSWIVPMGAAGATIVAAWLVEAKQSVIENMAPVLTRVFSPLTVLLLGAVIVAFAVNAARLDANRDLLVVMALLLVLVLGLWLYAVSAREPLAAPGTFDWILLALLIGALIVDAIVLTSMVSRIAEFGLSANKVSALGLNVVVLVNLVRSAWLCGGFLRGTRPFATIERWQTDYLPVYAAWAALVMVVVPPVFGFV